MKRWSRNQAISLMEVLVTLSIIAVVAAITYPVVAHAKLAAKSSKTLDNLHSLQLAALLYQADNSPAQAGTPEQMGLPPMFGTVRPFAGTQTYLAPWYADMKSPFGDTSERDYYTFGIPASIDHLPYTWSDCTEAIGDHCILYFDPFEPGRDSISGWWVSTVSLVTKRLHGVALAGNIVTHEDVGSPYNQAWWNPELNKGKLP